MRHFRPVYRSSISSSHLSTLPHRKLAEWRSLQRAFCWRNIWYLGIGESNRFFFVAKVLQCMCDKTWPVHRKTQLLLSAGAQILNMFDSLWHCYDSFTRTLTSNDDKWHSCKWPKTTCFLLRREAFSPILLFTLLLFFSTLHARLFTQCLLVSRTHITRWLYSRVALAIAHSITASCFSHQPL